MHNHRLLTSRSQRNSSLHIDDGARAAPGCMCCVIVGVYSALFFDLHDALTCCWRGRGGR